MELEPQLFFRSVCQRCFQLELRLFLEFSCQQLMILEPQQFR